MKIGIDARCLEWQRGGVARFLVKYIELAPKQNPDDLFILYFQEKVPSDSFLVQKNIKCKIIKGPQFLKKKRIICEQILLPFSVWEESIDCFFSPWYTAPLAIFYKKIIVAAWDISYITHPNHYTFSNRISLGLFGKLTYTFADALITCSEFDAEQILKFTNTKPDNLYTFNFPAEDKFDLEVSDSLLKQTLSRLNIKIPYILSLGVIYNRRNLPTLLHAFKNISNKFTEFNLVIVGKNATSPKIDFQDLIEELNLEDKTVQINYLDEKDLLPVYKGAFVYYCTSDVDGEAILVKEALRAGVPVVSSLLLEKTIKGYGSFVTAPDSVEEVDDTLSAIIGNPEEIRKKTDLGKNWIRTINWEDEIYKTSKFIKSKI